MEDKVGYWLGPDIKEEPVEEPAEEPKREPLLRSHGPFIPDLWDGEE